VQDPSAAPLINAAGNAKVAGASFTTLDFRVAAIDAA
jgi:hypothetical protein